MRAIYHVLIMFVSKNHTRTDTDTDTRKRARSQARKRARTHMTRTLRRGHQRRPPARILVVDCQSALLQDGANSRNVARECRINELVSWRHLCSSEPLRACPHAVQGAPDGDQSNQPERENTCNKQWPRSRCVDKASGGVPQLRVAQIAHHVGGPSQAIRNTLPQQHPA